MKHVMIAATITVFAASGAFADNRIWTGKISDSMCGLSHKAVIEHGGSGRKMTDAQCTEACVKGGAKYVFISSGKVYTITNQDFKDLAKDEGKTVTVRLEGNLVGQAITVTMMTIPAKKAAPKR